MGAEAVTPPPPTYAYHHVCAKVQQLDAHPVGLQIRIVMCSSLVPSYLLAHLPPRLNPYVTTGRFSSVLNSNHFACRNIAVVPRLRAKHIYRDQQGHTEAAHPKITLISNAHRTHSTILFTHA